MEAWNREQSYVRNITKRVESACIEMITMGEGSL